MGNKHMKITTNCTYFIIFWWHLQTKVSGTKDGGATNQNLLNAEMDMKSQSAPVTPSTDEKMQLN